MKELFTFLRRSCILCHGHVVITFNVFKHSLLSYCCLVDLLDRFKTGDQMQHWHASQSKHLCVQSVCSVRFNGRFNMICCPEWKAITIKFTFNCGSLPKLLFI